MLTRIIMINRNGKEKKEEMGEKMMLMLLEKRKTRRGEERKGKRKRRGKRKEDGKWEREEEKGEEQGGGRRNGFSGLLWVLNDIMFVKFPAQVLAQVIKSPKAMINKSNSNYGRVTRRDSKSD